MDTYLYNTQYMGERYTHEIIEGAEKCLKRSRDELIPHDYLLEFKKYPPYLLQDPS